MNIIENIPLKDYCTYYTGGPARYLALPANIEELKEAITWADAKSIPHEVIGFGANLLISDDGYEGVVISLREFEKWCVRRGNTLIAGAGAMLNHVIHYAVEEGLAGLEHLSGIPSTVGGAVRMNAGAYGHEIKDFLTRVNTLKRLDGLQEEMLDNSGCVFSYRESKGLDKRIVLTAEFGLEEGDRDALRRTRKEILAKRLTKQPLNYPSCGSVFKRAGEVPAAKLIEECGLKGKRIGGAEVSQKHANFIVNIDDAKSSDILSLINFIKLTVFKETGVKLNEEVKYLGF